MNQDKITLNVLCNTDNEWLDHVIAEYEAVNTGIKINSFKIEKPFSFEAKMTAKLVDDNNTIDVIYIDSNLLKLLIEARQISPIPQLTQWPDLKHFSPELLKGISEHQGEYYAIPVCTDVRGLWYSKSIFSKAGISIPWKPKTWAEIIEACMKIKKELPDIWPLTFGILGKYEATTMQTALMLLLGTKNVLYDKGRWLVESQGLYDSFCFINTVYGNDLGTPVRLFLESDEHKNFISYPHIDNIAVILDGNWRYSSMEKHCPEKISDFGFTMFPTEFGQAPGFITVSGGLVFAISAQSRNKKEAAGFMMFATNKKNILLYSMMCGSLSPRTDVSRMKEYPEEYKKLLPFFKYSKYRPSCYDYPIVSAELSCAVERVATQKNTPEQSMKIFADNLVRLLGKDRITREPYVP